MYLNDATPLWQKDKIIIMDNTIYRHHLEKQEVNNLLKKHNRRIK
jgi:hypothetical protein